MLIQPISNQTQTTPSVGQGGIDFPKVVSTPAQATTDTAQANTKSPTAEQLKDAVKVINQAMHEANQSLAFSIDSTTKRTIVKLTDTATGEVIRQFPTQETLAISQSIDQYQRGLLLTQKA